MTTTTRKIVPSSPWVCTHNGGAIPLRTAVPGSEISALDLAHHLSLINRWAGATTRPISVAEHSLLVVEIAQREMGLHSPDVLLSALLHDAHEAYMGDISTPVKSALGYAVAELEAALSTAVLQRFGVLNTARIFSSPIKAADSIALATEARDLMQETPARQQMLAEIGAHILPAPWIDLNSRSGLTWEDWRQAWLDAFTCYSGSPELRAEA